MARFLKNVSPGQITLDFLKDITTTKKYFERLKNLKKYGETIKKHVGNVRHFVQFLKAGDPQDVGEDTKVAAEHFLQGLKNINKALNEKEKRGKKIG